MLIKIIINFFLGYLKIGVEGFFIERFINLCRNDGILLWNIKIKNSSYIEANIGIGDFRKIKNILNKTKCKSKIKEKKGLPFFLHKYKKRKIFGIMLAIIIFIVIFLSRYVWNIELIVPEGIDKNEILKSLEENGLFIGELKKDIDIKEIINNIRLARKDISWIGIELNGTNAIVKVVKSDEKPEIIEENEFCNIISDKDAKIVKVDTQNGTAAVKPGDTVKKGSLLIAGWMEGKYTGIRFVHATGNIQANVWYTQKEKVSLEETKQEKTGNKETKYILNINNFKINLYKKLSNFEKYDTIYASKKIKIFSNFYIPVEITECNNFEIKEQTINYTEEEAKEEAKNRAEQKLLEEIKNKENIKNKTVNFYENGNEIEAEVTYEVFENIGTNEKIVF